MKLIKKLQECSTIGQADPILAQLGAGPAVKKLVETAIILSNSQDPQQRSHAYSFMESAIKEMEDGEDKLRGEEDDPTKNKIHEEELKNHNNGPRADGSEQSTENQEPYSKVAGNEPNEKGMNTSTGENQFSEAGGMIVPGLAPDIAQEMGAGMPNLPPMDTNQAMRQMQYTVAPLYKHMKHLSESVRDLSNQIREAKAFNGTMKLDIDNVKNNASARFRETVPNLSNDGNNFQPLIDQRSHKNNSLENARSEITSLNKMMLANKSMYQ